MPNVTPIRIELLSSGIVEFVVEDRTGPIFTATRKTTQVRRVWEGTNANQLSITWEDNAHQDVFIAVQSLEQIITPGPVIQSYTPIADLTDFAAIQARLDEVYAYLIRYVFRGCCDDGTPIPGPYICKTYAEWDVIRLAGELPEGLWVCVTDIPSQPSATFALFCKEVDQFALGGFGTFLNADWQNVGDYSGVFAITGVAFTANVGQWYVGLESTAVDGDVVIWNCLHYQVIDAASFAGTDPATNTSAYTLLPKATANTGYISEVDDIEFDFPNDWLQYRADKRGNTYRYSESVDSVFALGYTAIDLFQWGRDAVHSINASESRVDILNVVEPVFFADIVDYCSFFSITAENGAVVSNIQLSNNSIIASISIDNSTFAYVSLDNNSTISSLTATNSSSFSNISATNNCGISGNTLDASQIIDMDLSNSGNFNVNSITTGSVSRIKIQNRNSYENKTIAGETIENIVIAAQQQFTESLTSRSGITHVPGKSNDFRSLDITGLTSVDIGTNAELVGIYNLTSGNATETITDFANFPTLFPFTIRPAAGLIVTLTITPVASISATGEIVDASATIVLDGDNGDEATMQVQSIGGFDVLVVTEVVQML